MRKRFTWIAVALLIIGFPFLLYLKSNSGHLESNREENFLIGTWVIERDQSSAEFSIYEIEFVDSNTMICNASYNGQDYYNIKFHYSFIGGNRISITAPRRLSSEWEVMNDGGRLLIMSSFWPNGVGVFRRTITINWPIIAYWLGLCVIGSFFVTIPRTRIKEGKSGIARMGQNQFAGLSKYVIQNIIALVFFIGGVIGGLLIWSLPPLLRVRLPWDSIITMESGAILFIFGTRTLKAKHRDFMESKASWIYDFGVFLTGSGISGIIAGAIGLFLFIETGFYP